jgi:predicted O-linked N-acetylglucosamine transferase (SPINDLY family)
VNIPERDLAIDAALRVAQTGDTAEAVRQLRDIAARFPDSGEPWRLIGVLALQRGDPVGARSALERALLSEPGSPAILCNLATLARGHGDDDAAEQFYRDALARDPGHVVAHNNLGGLLFNQGRLKEAELHYREALATMPGYAPARGNLAACLLALDRTNDALAEAELATAAAPDYAPVWLSLAQIRQAANDVGPAVTAFERVLALGMRTADVFYGLAQALDDEDRCADSLAACESALALDPRHGAAASLAQYLRRRLCRHGDLEHGHMLLSRLLADGRDGIAPFAFLSEEATPAQQRQVAELAAKGVQQRVDARLNAPGPAAGNVHTIPMPGRALGDRTAGAGIAIADAHVERNIRVGFVSSGFGQHPTALLIVDLIERLRGSGIDAIGYATTADDGGELRQRLGKAFAHLHDVSGLGPTAMAERLRDDGLDVAIDLRGWGGGSVAEMFVQRPAPVQVNWLAYPGTSGAPWIDYLLADAFVVPDAERDHYSEALVRLPHCFQPSDTTRQRTEPLSRAVLQLPGDATVFACFNNAYKYSPASLVRFWSILHGVPGAVLWLLDGRHDEVRDNLRAMARAAGIDPSRLVFLPRQSHERYLACYAHADLFLDTTPYNAHTTASDALWSGCPVLTLPGRTFASRVAGSLNRSLGLGEMNAIDDDGFIDAAIVLGRDRTALLALRERLASARVTSPLFEMDAFARDFRRALMMMVERQRAGLPPADFDLDREPA